MSRQPEHIETDGENDPYMEEEQSWLPRTPSATVLNLGNYFDKKFNANREDSLLSGLTLLDTMETFFDARLDLFERQLKKQRDRIQTRATLLAKERRDKLKTTTEEYDKELQKFKLKVSQRLTRVTEAWQSSRVIRTREKLVFFTAVMNVFGTSLLIGLAPEWIHVVYTLQVLYLLPLRFFQYKAKGWAYFLADLCYFANIITVVFLWIAPWSDELFMACYCLTHGSLATAVITWRNSLVFHDHDKMVSLFIHMYPPLVLTIVRHFYPNAGERFPAMKVLPTLHPLQALTWSAAFYLLWQGLYWRFLLVRRADKIKSGLRTTSFSYLSKDKHNPIGKMIRAVNPARAEFYFMMGQFAYSIVTELPAIFVLYNSKTWSVVFLAIIFAASAWNGGGYYIEVFGRKFERELDALRKELATAQSQSSHSGHSTPFGGSLPNSPQVVAATPDIVIEDADADSHSPANDNHAHDQTEAPATLIDDADKHATDEARKRFSVLPSAQDVASMDAASSASSTSTSTSLDTDIGLQLYDEARKNQ